MKTTKQGSIIKGPNWPEPIVVKLIEEIGDFFHIVGATKNSGGEIEKNYPQDYMRYFKEAKLPNGNTGNFQKYAFEKAIANVTDAWKKLYEGLKTKIIVAQVIRNWNLDTGIDMNINEKTYWV